MDNKSFTRYRRVIFLEIGSVIFGVVGLFFGILGLIALFMSSAYNYVMSLILTYGWTVVDCVSIFFSTCAVLYALRTRRKDHEENYKVKKASRRASVFDNISVLFGLIGLVFAILSIIYNNYFIHNMIFSILTVLFDIASMMCVAYSFHYLLTELWNSFKFIIKKAKTTEILKTRKIMEKNLKSKFEVELKEKIKAELAEHQKHTIDEED